MYLVVFEPKARKALEKFSRWPDQARQLDAALMALSTNPRPKNCLKLKLSKPTSWRVRAGDVRIVYTINDLGKVITVVDIDYRDKVYKKR